MCRVSIYLWAESDWRAVVQTADCRSWVILYSPMLDTREAPQLLTGLFSGLNPDSRLENWKVTEGYETNLS